jgi:hypothetical protein
VKKIDYYASWPNRSIPKWLGAVLGGVFTSIAVGSGFMAYALTHPAPTHRALAPLAAPTAPVATTAGDDPVTAKPKVDVSAAAVVPAPPAETSKKPRTTPKRPAAVLAKHDTKAKRSAKSDLDRLLGL